MKNPASLLASGKCEVSSDLVAGVLNFLLIVDLRFGLLHEYMGHDVSNMRGFDSYRLLTLSLAALMTRISSVVMVGAHTSAGAATLARTVPFWGRFRSPREPTAGPCRGCLQCHKHCAVPPSPTGCLV